MSRAPSLQVLSVVDKAITRLQEMAREENSDAIERRRAEGAVIASVINNAAYGKGACKLLADRLGRSRAKLYKLAKFATAFDVESIASAENLARRSGISLTFSMLEALVGVESPSKRQEFLQQAMENGWSATQLGQVTSASMRSQRKARKGSTASVQSILVMCSEIRNHANEWTLAISEARASTDRLVRERAESARQALMQAGDDLYAVYQAEPSGSQAGGALVSNRANPAPFVLEAEPKLPATREKG